MLDTSDQIQSLIDDPYSVPLEQLDPSHGELFRSQKHHDVFKRLRVEDPVHFTPDSPFGPFWSITKFDDILAVDSDHNRFSSEPVISIGDNPDGLNAEAFIAMDPPRHSPQRLAASGAVSPKRILELEPLIRKRVCTILNDLPRNEEFNWVDLVSREMTMKMLATLFALPQEDRHLLTKWSDATTGGTQFGAKDTDEQERISILMEALAYFQEVWADRAAKEPAADFISLLAHNPDTSGMIERPLEFLGNMMLLVVGGNDTTRNSASGGVVALNDNPDEYDKLRSNSDLIPNMVSEIIRWQTPLSHMRRVAKEDVTIGGKSISRGDKVIMWYCSGNRDQDAIPQADRFLIDRTRARHHISFGFGIHRCLGNRVAEMQLRILWEEIMRRFDRIEVVSEPLRISSNMVNGFDEVRVRIPS